VKALLMKVSRSFVETKMIAYGIKYLDQLSWVMLDVFRRNIRTFKREEMNNYCDIFLHLLFLGRTSTEFPIELQIQSRVL